MTRQYSPMDSVSNEIGSAVSSAQTVGCSFEDFVRVTRECWIEELQREIDRVSKTELK